ncbi:MAG: hypothetical protein MJ212_01945 [Alphaproteobacteria bacterium]|nr:hypothetical protein [Alphaproteobacteria bacterium]
MAILNLYKSSGLPREMCMIYCKAQANLYLECTNATLVRLVTSSKHEHIAWYDPAVGKNPSGELAFTRAFVEVSAYFVGDSYEIVDIQPIVADKDMFFVNGDLYFLHRQKNGDEVIRKITIYSRQEMVETLNSYTDEENEVWQAIYLVHCYLIKNNGLEYAFTAWGMASEDTCSYLPVFHKDYHFMEEYEIGNFEKKQVQVGESFKAHGYFYKVLEDAEGKLCLDQSKSIFTLYHGTKIGDKGTKMRKNPLIISFSGFARKIDG